jgi:hypothetical protein
MNHTIAKIIFYGDVVSELALLLWMEAYGDVAGCQSHSQTLKSSGSFLPWLVESVVSYGMNIA